MSDIPRKARQAVRDRDEHCQRCGGPGTDWHHRRRRNVKNGHDPHCACIGILLCRLCHNSVHSNPKRSMETGYIISSYEEEPWEVPVKTIYGFLKMDCQGNAVLIPAPETPPVAGVGSVPPTIDRDVKGSRLQR